MSRARYDVIRRLMILGLAICCTVCRAEGVSINLAGRWSFQLDPHDVGEKDNWCNQPLPEQVRLPASIQEQGFGQEPSTETRWTGTIFDRRWFTADRYQPYRQPGNINSYYPGRPDSARFGTAQRPHRMDFALRAGERVAVCWINEGEWFGLDRERRPISMAKIPPFYGNGVIVYEPTTEGDAATFANMVSTDGVLRAAKPGERAECVYHACCPYVFTIARIVAKYAAARPGSVQARKIIVSRSSLPLPGRIQSAFVVTCHSRSPPPSLVIVSSLGLGLLPPTFAEKLKLVGLTSSTGLPWTSTSSLRRSSGELRSVVESAPSPELCSALL